LTLEFKKKVRIAAEFKYSDTGSRVGINPVILSVPGTPAVSELEDVIPNPIID
jgi:hypothetical protein